MTEGAAMTSPQTELVTELELLQARVRQIRVELKRKPRDSQTARERAAKRWNMD